LLPDCSKGLVIASGGCVQTFDVDIEHSHTGVVVFDDGRDMNVKFERLNCRCDQVKVFKKDSIP
jgi:hypothetical protein